MQIVFVQNLSKKFASIRYQNQEFFFPHPLWIGKAANLQNRFALLLLIERRHRRQAPADFERGGRFRPALLGFKR